MTIVKQGKYLRLNGKTEDLQVGEIGYTYEKDDSIYPIPHIIKIRGANTRDTGDGGGHSHTISTTSTNSGAASGNTVSTGSGNSHTNLQPYYTCYIWCRTK